ncbi:MAG: MFS transporter [Candidatus Cyclobacteriaceae bacterium M2_1C_046]
MNRQWVLPVIVFSQFAGTSLWFAGNAIITDLQQNLHLQDDLIGHITSAVQFGFIFGTLLFAMLTIADRFSPSKVFLFCALGGAFVNLSIIFLAEGFYSLIAIRFLTGIFLAGIYPVGMKIASDWHQKGLGKALGFLVGALVVGTAFPHLVSYFTREINWQLVVWVISILAATGGLLIYFFVPDGPFRKKSNVIDLTAFFKVFSKKDFRSAALGYFGHMWELYAFWAFVPVILLYYQKENSALFIDISLLSFIIIAIGGISCIAGGFIAERYGSPKVAFSALLISCLCCIFSFAIFDFSPLFFILYLVVWGLAVIADSPQFSTLVAKTAPTDYTGTALTVVNSFGFLITIFSIQLINFLYDITENANWIFLLLAPGPVIGLLFFSRILKKEF